MSSTLPAAQADAPALPGFLPNLMRELDAAPPIDGRFSPVLAVHQSTAAEPLGRMCGRCCHWSLPLWPPYTGRDLPASVAMLYHEWLVWDLHVVRHQMGVLVS